VLLYGAQNGVCSAAMGGGDEVGKRVLRVRRFMGKHGDGLWSGGRGTVEEQKFGRCEGLQVPGADKRRRSHHG
jgi:hypothetical protein